MGVRDILLPLFTLPNALPGAAQYTFGPGGTNQKMNVVGWKLVNLDTVAHTVTAHHVPSGGAAGPDNVWMPNASIPANTTWEDGYNIGEWVLRSGDSIWIWCDAANVVNFYLAGEADE